MPASKNLETKFAASFDEDSRRGNCSFFDQGGQTMDDRLGEVVNKLPYRVGDDSWVLCILGLILEGDF